MSFWLALPLLPLLFTTPLGQPIKASSSPDSPLILKIKVAVDPSFKNLHQPYSKEGKEFLTPEADHKERQARIKNIFALATQDFKQQGMNVELKIVSFEDWRPKPDLENKDRLVDDLESSFAGSKEFDLIVGFTDYQFPPPTDKPSKQGGVYLSQKPSAYIAIKDSGSVNKKEMSVDDLMNVKILDHEIGHYFLGLNHSNDEKSIMNEVVRENSIFLPDEVRTINNSINQHFKNKAGN